MAKQSKIQNKILFVLKKSKKPLTAQEIHKKVPNVDLATIYRNIKKLQQSQEVTELLLKKGESQFEINLDNHQHAICKVCGKIEHIKVNTSKLLDSVNITDFEIEDIEITFKGHCKT